MSLSPAVILPRLRDPKTVSKKPNTLLYSIHLAKETRILEAFIAIRNELELALATPFHEIDGFIAIAESTAIQLAIERKKNAKKSTSRKSTPKPTHKS
jgi:hypothetical protein